MSRDRAFRGRQALLAALTVNALHPVPGYWAGVPAMVAGWLTGELAPQLLAAAALDDAVHLAPGRRDARGLTLGAAGVAGLSYLVAQSARAKGDMDRALREALGQDYLGYLDALGRVDTDIDLATPWQQLAFPFRVRDDEVEVVKDVPYNGTAGRRGLLDVYRPRRPGRAGDVTQPAPVLLQVHGGAWTIGSKDAQGIPLMLHMAARGWVCVAINYRLSPQVRFPDHLVDVKRALAWIRRRIQEYGGDPSYVAVTGGSAGGHLAALAALTPGDPEYQPGFEDADTTVQAAVPHYGVYDLAGATGTRRALQLRDRFLARRVLFEDARTGIEQFERASPLLRVNPAAPPFLVIHGAHDSLVPVDQARAFVRRLRQVSSNPVAYAELPGAQHAFDVFPSIRSAHVVRGVDRFLRWNHARWLSTR